MRIATATSTATSNAYASAFAFAESIDPNTGYTSTASSTATAVETSTATATASFTDDNVDIALQGAIDLANTLAMEKAIQLTSTSSKNGALNISLDTALLVDPMHITFKLLTLNDTYTSTYFGRWGQIANNIEKDNTTSDTVFLRFFGGDFLSPNKFTSIMQCNDMVLSTNSCHFNAIGLGNHEFDSGQELLKQFALMSNSPFVCSNISEETCNNLNINYNKIIMQGDVQIGVISFVTLETPDISIGAVGIDFYNIDTMFNNQQSFLESNNMNILIFHENIQNIIDYLNLHPERKNLVDAIICGHEHIIYANYIERDGYKIPIVEMGLDSSGIGCIEIKYNLSTKKPDNSFVEVKVINPLAPILPEVKTLDDWIYKIVDPYFKQNIGIVVDYGLDGLSTNIRNKETNLGDLVADSYLYCSYNKPFAIKPENIFSFHNSGSIRNNSIIPVGTQLTSETVYTITPFINNLVAIVVTGRTNANKLIKYIAETSFSKKGAGAWAQISKNLVFDFVNKNYSLTGGSDSETDLFYLIVTNYLSNGNDGYTDLKNYDKLLMDIPCQNATIDYIKYLNNVSYTTNYTRIIQ